jgi:hypothetical protein
MTNYREMNDQQHRCLDRISERDPDAVVIDWMDTLRGRGPVVRFSSGELGVVNMTGRIRKVDAPTEIIF